MSALLVLISLYLGMIAAVGAWAAVRLVRRDAASLGQLRAHVVAHGFVMSTTTACAVAAALTRSARPYLLAAAVLLYGGSRLHFAWMERHDTTEPGPPLQEAEATRLRSNASRARRTAIWTAASVAVLVPVLWLETGWPWAVALLGAGLVSLYAQLWRLPRLYERTIERRGLSGS